jgi:hypothetical protein
MTGETYTPISGAAGTYAGQPTTGGGGTFANPAAVPIVTTVEASDTQVLVRQVNGVPTFVQILNTDYQLSALNELPSAPSPPTSTAYPLNTWLRESTGTAGDIFGWRLADAGWVVIAQSSDPVIVDPSAYTVAFITPAADSATVSGLFSFVVQCGSGMIGASLYDEFGNLLVTKLLVGSFATLTYDTTKLTDGVHTLFATAFDQLAGSGGQHSAGAHLATASRAVIVANNAATPSPTPAPTPAPVAQPARIQGKITAAANATSSATLACALNSSVSVGSMIWGVLSWPSGTSSLATPSKVQGVDGSFYSGANVTSLVLSLGATVGNGRFVNGVVTWDSSTGATISSVVDDKGNTYTVDKSLNDGTHSQSAAIFHRGNITNAPIQVTVNFSAACSFMQMGLEEWSGVDTAAPVNAVDGQLVTSGSTAANAMASPSITPTVNGCLIWGCDSTIGTPGVSVGTGYTSQTALLHLTTESKIQAVAGAVTATFTSAAAADHFVFIMALKPATLATTTLVSIADEKGNSYLPIDTLNDATHSRSACSFSALNITNAPQTITATFSAAISGTRMSVTEYSNVQAASALEAHAAASSTSTATDGMSSGPFLPVSAGDLVLGGAATTNGAHGAVAGTNFTLVDSGADSDTIPLESEFYLQPAAASLASTFTAGGASTQLVFGAAFKPASSSPSPAPAGFLPTSIASLVLWLDFGDLATVTAAAGVISTVADKSGHGNAAVAGTGGGPTQVLSAVNGRAIARFPATGTTSLKIAASSSLNDIYANGGTVLAIYKPTGGGVSGYGRICDKGGAGLEVDQFGSLVFHQAETNAAGTVVDKYWGLQSGADLSIGQITHALVQYSRASTANQASFRLNGTLHTTLDIVNNVDGTATINSDATSPFTVGITPGLTDNFQGDLLALMAFNAPLSSADMASLEAFNASVWALSMASATPTPSPSPGPTPATLKTAIFTAGDSSIETSTVAFETWLGRPVAAALQFGGAASSSDFTGSTGFEFSLGSPSRKLIYSQPLIWSGADLATAAAGGYNSQYQSVAATIATAYRAGQIFAVRIGWEFNGSWYPWNTHDGSSSDYAKAFALLAGFIKSAAPGILIVWCPNWSQQDPKPAWPGGAFVDIMALDLYENSQYLSGSGLARWNGFLSTGSSLWDLNQHEAYATLQAKPMAFGEYATNYNDGTFVDQSAAWMKARNVAYHCYWDSNSAFTGLLSQYPLVQTAFFNDWHAG